MQLRKDTDRAQVEAHARVTGVEAPVITYAADGCVMGHLQNVLITIWATPATVPLIAQFAKLAEKLNEIYPRTSAAHIMLETAGMPSGDARKALEELSDRFESRVACVATMITGAGFWPSALRGLVTGMQVVQRKPFKANTFATVPPLAAWLAAQNQIATSVECGVVTLEKTLSSMLRHPALRGRGAA